MRNKRDRLALRILALVVLGAGFAVAASVKGDAVEQVAHQARLAAAEPQADGAADDTSGLDGGAVPEMPTSTSSTTSTTLPPSAVPTGTGEFTIAPGTGPRVGSGSLYRYRVEVEDGLDVDPSAFAAEVERTLSDPRSWSGTERVAVQRVDSDSVQFRVLLASPATTDELCRPLRTNSILSCEEDGKAILNYWRWLAGDDDYGDDVGSYRIYMVNHEVGHALGHGHVGCPAAGEPAPVMMQQTKSIDSCAPNPWPLDSER